jgi:hypothetical protein
MGDSVSKVHDVSFIGLVAGLGQFIKAAGEYLT